MNETLGIILSKLVKGQKLTNEEQNYIISKGVVNFIIEEVLDKIFSKKKNNKNLFDKDHKANSLEDSKLNAYEGINSVKKKTGENDFCIDKSYEDMENRLNSISNLKYLKKTKYDNDKNKEEENKSDHENITFEELSENGKKKRKLINDDVKNSQKYDSLIKYEEGIKNKGSKYKKRKNNRPRKLESEDLMHKIIIDFINPKDLKEGLLKQKQFLKSLTLNPINYKKTDENLLKKNLRIIYSNSPENNSERDYRKIKTKDLIKQTQILKNLNTLTNTCNIIRENWKLIFNNPTLEENIKLKFMDILSNKNHLKNKIEEKVLESISTILTDNLNSDKNNKLSKQLIKLYRRENTDLEIEEFNSKAKNVFPNPMFFSAKARILQENKDYLISAYFDIYNDILTDIFNSEKTIFDFNEDIKGKSILNNFQIYNKNARQIQTTNNNENKDFYSTKFEAIKNASQNRRINLNSYDSLSSLDKPKFLLNKELTLNNKNNFNVNNLNVNEINTNTNDDDDLRSNYDRLGLANQTYINNILLRDFSFKEKINYIENSRSDKVSDNSYINSTLRIHENDSISVSYNLESNKSKKEKFQSKVIQLFKEPIKNIAKKLQRQNNNLEDNILNENFGIKLNKNNNYEEKRNSLDKKRNTSDEFNEDENHFMQLSNSSVKDHMKKKKKKDNKRNKKNKLKSDYTVEISKKNQIHSSFKDMGINMMN